MQTRSQKKGRWREQRWSRASFVRRASGLKGSLLQLSLVGLSIFISPGEELPASVSSCSMLAVAVTPWNAAIRPALDFYWGTISRIYLAPVNKSTKTCDPVIVWRLTVWQQCERWKHQGYASSATCAVPSSRGRFSSLEGQCRPLTNATVPICKEWFGEQTAIALNYQGRGPEFTRCVDIEQESDRSQREFDPVGAVAGRRLSILRYTRNYLYRLASGSGDKCSINFAVLTCSPEIHLNKTNGLLRHSEPRY